MRYGRFLALIFALSVQAGLSAQNEEHRVSTEERLNQLETRLRQIEDLLRRARKRELEQENLAAMAALVPIVSAGDDGFALRSKSGDYRLSLGMTAQTDGM